MILITGSTGYIGSHISLYFERNNIDFVGIDNLSYSRKGNVTKNQKHFFFDISNENKINKIISKYNPKTIIHCAANSYVLEAENNKKKYFLNNIVKTKKFIDICNKRKIDNFIFMSSSNVYNEKYKSSIFSENNKTEPKNYYGKNKIIIEDYLKKKKFKKLIILRLFNIIGISNNKFKSFQFKQKNYQRLIFSLLQNYKKKQITYINKINHKGSDVFPERDFLDINDLLIILRKLLAKISKVNKISSTFNVGSGKSISINRVVRLMNSYLNNKLKLKTIKLNNKEMTSTRSSIKKISKYLNYNPKLSLKKSITSHLKQIKC